ncbi:hypothetical protein PoB_004517800 [Plakobranchus ocellatus]|uniref:Uncharacterized protein n=1 Tax=Plakobranchus ocellatus TaxID=259542 RepID=A0AAV4BIP6_9GAST|nr:hypothetical protein PoB_004517800 [Plakobranchus ocellatus]
MLRSSLSDFKRFGVSCGATEELLDIVLGQQTLSLGRIVSLPFIPTEFISFYVCAVLMDLIPWVDGRLRSSPTLLFTSRIRIKSFEADL